MQQLSGLDATFIHSELDGLPQHIGGVTIYNPRTAAGKTVRFEDILELLRSRVHLSPIFTRKLAQVPLRLGQPYWVPDPDFDLEYHVRQAALPAPGTWAQLCELAGRIHSRPLSRENPLWEIYIIEGLDAIKGIPKGCFAMLLKVHHAAMDGATGPLFMNVMHDLSPEVQVPKEPAGPEEGDVSRVRMLGKAYIDALTLPLRVAKFVGNTLPSVQRVRQGLKQKEFAKAVPPPTSRFQGRISNDRVINAIRFDFAEVRAMKQTVKDATINDVMLAVIGGGLRHYLQDKNELPGESLSAGCPIDVRDADEKSSGGNMIGLMTVALCTDIKQPLQRLQEIGKHSRDAKAYAQAMGPRLGADITDLVPGAVMAVALRAAAATGMMESSVMCNTVVTNVPGAPFQLYLCGAEMVDGFSMGPLMPNIGLFQVIYSSVQNKEGTLTLSVTACPKMLPDSEHYMQCLQRSFDELKAAVSKPSAKARGKPKMTTISKPKTPLKRKQSGKR